MSAIFCVCVLFMLLYVDVVSLLSGFFNVSAVFVGKSDGIIRVDGKNV